MGTSRNFFLVSGAYSFSISTRIRFRVKETSAYVNARSSPTLIPAVRMRYMPRFLGVGFSVR